MDIAPNGARKNPIKENIMGKSVVVLGAQLGAGRGFRLMR